MPVIARVKARIEMDHHNLKREWYNPLANLHDFCEDKTVNTTRKSDANAAVWPKHASCVHHLA